MFVVSAAAETLAVRTALARGALSYRIKPFPDELLVERMVVAYSRCRSVLDRLDVLGQSEIDPAGAPVQRAGLSGTMVW